MKTLVLDIETSPSLAYVWSLWDQNVTLDKLVDTGQVICFAAKWLDQKKVMFHSDFHDGHEAMILKAYELIDQADAIIHYNGRAFDIKHLNWEFLLAGLLPPSPHKDIDLYSVIRTRFKPRSTKLQHVATELGIGSKKETGGFQTWIGCMKGDPTAWKNMRTYNIGDVTLTEDLYYLVRGWIRNHPNVLLYDGITVPACTTCTSTNRQKRGQRHTNVSSFQRFRCLDCGKYDSATIRTDHVTTTSAN